MNKTGSNLLFLAVGALLGAAVGYVAASEKKEEWLNDIGSLVSRVKKNVVSSRQSLENQNFTDDI